MATKVCSKCGVEKDVGEFGRLKKTKDGLRTVCKVCVRQYRDANKERISQYMRQYRDANKEAIADWHRENYKANTGRIRSQHSDYYAANTAKILAQQREYAAANRCLIAARKSAYYKANKGAITEYKRGYYKCATQTLADTYIRQSIRVRNPSPEIIEAKREQLEIYRLTKQIKGLVTEKTEEKDDDDEE